MKRELRYQEEMQERERSMQDIRESHTRVGGFRGGSGLGDGGDDEEGIGYGRRQKTATELNMRKEQRKRYQFEATASDDELEDELDDNLDEISDMTKRLKALGSAMGEELDRQNERIGRITEKTDGLDNRLFRNTQAVRIGVSPLTASNTDASCFISSTEFGRHNLVSRILVSTRPGVWCGSIIWSAVGISQVAMDV